MFYLVLDNLRSALNVGAVFRTAEALGVKKIYLCGITPQPNQANRAGRELAKTALGAEKFLAWEKKGSSVKLMKKLREQGFKIFALEQNPQAVNLFRWQSRRRPENFVLILGNEVSGLKPSLLQKCDKIIYIPMFGRKESLNVSVAFGIAGYFLKAKGWF